MTTSIRPSAIWRMRRTRPPPTFAIEFERLASDAVALDGRRLSPASLVAELTRSGAPTGSAGQTWSRTDSSA